MYLCEGTETAAAVPESVLHYVVRTRESLLLDDATRSPFSADRYISNRQTRSILCLPLITQAKLIGALYLENNLTSRAFAPARLSVLKLLSSQAAIALENAQLYADAAKREAKIQRLVDANIVGIIIWELGGRILEANDAFLQIVGYDREDLVAGRLHWTDLTPPERLDGHERWWIPELKQMGSVQPFEMKYIRKDGSRVPVLVGVASFEESENQGISFVLDLTDRKRAEDELRASEARFRMLVDHATDAIFLHDEHQIVRDVNRQACESLGYRREELIGLHPREFDVGLDAQGFGRVGKRVRSGETVTFELFTSAKAGACSQLRSGFASSSSAVEYFRLALVRDITNRKRVEQRLLAQHNVAQILANAGTIEEATQRFSRPFAST